MTVRLRNSFFRAGALGVQANSERSPFSIATVCLFFMFFLYARCYFALPDSSSLKLQRFQDNASHNIDSVLFASDLKSYRSQNVTSILKDRVTFRELSVRALDTIGADEEREAYHIAAWISFFLCTFLCAAALQWILSHISVYTFPVSIMWFIFGMIMSLAVSHIPEDDDPHVFPLVRGIQLTGRMNAEIVYFVFLPILLYEAALNLNWHKFKRFFISGVTLAVLGVAYQVGVVGVLVQYTLPNSEDPGSTWWDSFLFASAMASTDPVAVISVLNGLQAPPKLASMFDGEALINDGSSMLLFQFFKHLSRGESETWQAVVRKFFLLLFVGPIWGVAIGVLMYLWMRKFTHHADMQGLALMAAAYAVYFVGEKFLGTSGPISVVCFGLYYTAFSHIGLDNEAQLQHHHSVQALSSLANSSIFIIAGVVAMRMMREAIMTSDGLRDAQAYNVPILYFYLLISRASMVIIFLPILRRTGYGVNWKEVVLLVWGGLRGAIVLAMGLMIEQDHKIKSFMRYQAVLHIAGCTFMILLCNGGTFELLYKLLNPYPPKPFRKVYLERVMKMIDYQYLEERRILEDHWLFRGTGILYFSDRAVPNLGWRRMNDRGKIDFKLPGLTAAFHGLPSCDSWIPPSLLPPSFPKDNTVDTTERTGMNDYVPSLEVPISSSPVSGATPMSDRSIVGSSIKGHGPFERKFSSHVPTEGLDKDSEQRAHATTVSLLGLRDARSGLNTFDAKKYLRLIEHATDESTNSFEDQSPATLPTSTCHQPRLSSVKSCVLPSLEHRHRSISQPTTEDHRSDTLELSRFDTDKTITFKNEDDGLHKASSNWQFFNSTQPNLGTQYTYRTCKSAHVQNLRSMTSSCDSPSISSHQNRFQRSESNPQVFTDQVSEAKSPYFISSIEHAAAPPVHHSILHHHHPCTYSPSQTPHHLSKRVLVHSAVSEPFDSSSLDSNRLGIGRMTRLRKPEWDNRKGSSISSHQIAHHHSGLHLSQPYQTSTHQLYDDDADLMPPYRRQSDTDFIITFKKPSAFDKPPHFEEEIPKIEPPTNYHRKKLLLRKKNRRHTEGREYSSQNDGLYPKTKSAYTLNGPCDTKATSYTDQLLMPHRVVSAPLGHLEFGNLGFYSPKMDEDSSIDSAEEYLEMPVTPKRGFSIANAVGRIKILRKEREGELYIMAFNAIRQMYKKLYAQRFIGGSAMLSLSSVLDHSIDFSIGKLKKHPIKAWKDVLEDIAEDANNGDLLNDEVVTVTEGMTGFEFEFRALICRLKCIRKDKTLSIWLKNQFPEHSWLRAALTYAPAMSDLEQITAFVDVHEELLFKGGPSLENLLGSKLLFSFRKQVYDAKRFILVLRSSYPESFPYTLAVHAAALLINLKQQLIEEQAQKGLILEEDYKSLSLLLEDQHRNLSSFRPVNLSCLLWMGKFCRCGKCNNKNKSMTQFDVPNGTTYNSDEKSTGIDDNTVDKKTIE